MHNRFKIILLNQASHPIGVYHLSTGGINSSVVDVRIILSIALKTLATGIIILHNHPSSNLKPSDSDIRITEKLKEACSIMDIRLIDHLIICKDDYFSFADNGLI